MIKRRAYKTSDDFKSIREEIRIPKGPHTGRFLTELPDELIREYLEKLPEATCFGLETLNTNPYLNARWSCEMELLFRESDGSMQRKVVMEPSADLTAILKAAGLA